MHNYEYLYFEYSASQMFQGYKAFYCRMLKGMATPASKTNTSVPVNSMID